MTGSFVFDRLGLPEDAPEQVSVPLYNMGSGGAEPNAHPAHAQYAQTLALNANRKLAKAVSTSWIRCSSQGATHDRAARRGAQATWACTASRTASSTSRAFWRPSPGTWTCRNGPFTRAGRTGCNPAAGRRSPWGDMPWASWARCIRCDPRPMTRRAAPAWRKWTMQTLLDAVLTPNR